jgi:hypothetical protein
MDHTVQTISFAKLFGDTIPEECITVVQDENGVFINKIDLSADTLSQKYGKKLNGFLKIAPRYRANKYDFSIDLSNNELKEVIVCASYNISYLNLKNNCLKKVTLRVDAFSSIKKIDLSNNNLEQFPTTYHEAYIKSLSLKSRLILATKKFLEACQEKSYVCSSGVSAFFYWLSRRASNTSNYYVGLAGDKIATYEKLAVHSKELRDFMNTSSLRMSSYNPLAEYYLDDAQYYTRLKWGLGMIGIGIGIVAAYYAIYQAKESYNSAVWWRKNRRLPSANNIKVLNLSNNNISKIPHYIGEFKLRSLNLAGNNIEQLPYELTKLTNLQELNLLGNPLGQNMHKNYLKKNKIHEAPCGSINYACLQPVPGFSFIWNLFGKNIKEQKAKESAELYRYISKLRLERKFIDTRQINIVKNDDGILTGYLNTKPLKPSDPVHELRKLAKHMPYHVIQHINSYIYHPQK